jgi:tetratricopeptide (TPR) repeat protein
MIRSPFICALLTFAVLLNAGQAMAAGDLEEATRLHRDGASSAALQTIDSYLATHAKDAQMRFLKSVILADTGRPAEAAATLEEITQDFPDLAEPYNNLAVLRAATGDYARAREALEQALRLKPNYATARENLGDVYAALAGASYAEALRLEPARSGVEAKLARVRTISAPSRAASANPAAASEAASPRP